MWYLLYKKERKDFSVKIFNTITNSLTFIIMKVMYIYPIRVLALITDTTGTFGYELIERLLVFIIGSIGVLVFHNFAVYLLAIKAFLKKIVQKYIYQNL
ncbi:cation:dicarboxylate symporter family transporter [Clostridium rectalis]|uniref:cation:dicarboxylate symporter family transporter n=1 Tax=Clostridium rectalis TaxID=2040295 RepID=UPI000F637810|nr:cation:dicarboxylase symporter family transporter [Clostridium rectalis]